MCAYLQAERRAKKFVQLDDDSQTDEYIFFVFNANQVKHQTDKIFGMRFEVIVGGQTVNNFQDELSELLSIQLGNKHRLSFRQNFHKRLDRMFQKLRILRQTCDRLWERK